MSRLSSVLAAILASAAANAVLADSFTYIDHWPSGTGDETATEVLVPDGTTATIATADDVSRVERLTAVSFGGGESVLHGIGCIGSFGIGIWARQVLG